MSNKTRLPQATLIVALAIMLALITAYVPMLGILGLVVSVPYAIIGTLTNMKYSILSIIVTFLTLMISVDPIYALNICILSAMPGIAIGNMARKNMIEEEYNKFEPIYLGAIAFVVCTIIFFFVSKIIFNINLIDEFMGIINGSIKVQLDMMKNANMNITESLNANDIVNYVRNMIPTLLFFQGMILAFITYYLETFILKRIKRANLQMPKFADFYLPGNAVASSFMLYLLVLFIEIIGLNLHTELIMINLQSVFNFMFMAQGIAVCIYYIRKWIRQGSVKMVVFGGFILCITGFMGISFIGMLDSIIDFRKVRSYKSI